MIALLAALIMQDAPPPEADPDPIEIERLAEEAEQARADAQAREAEADALAAEIAELQSRLVQAAERVRARETEAGFAEARLMELEDNEALLLERLAAERDSLAHVLAALQRIELGAPPALAANPADAAEAARAAGLLANIAPQLERRANAVQASLDELRALREELTGQRETVSVAQSTLSSTREELEALIAERRDAERRLRAEADDLSSEAARIASRAESLRDLLIDIRRFAETEPRLAPGRPDREPAAPPVRTAEAGDGEAGPVPRLKPRRAEPAEAGALLAALPSTNPTETLRFSDARGRLIAPAGGRMITRANERGPDGQTRQGVWFENRPGAQVVAPFDGMVVFAGEFQSFDAVLMINTPDGYTLILGGIGLLYASEGQSVLAGEPVGALPDGETARLYFEIRRNSDQAEDPEQWLRPEHRQG